MQYNIDNFLVHQKNEIIDLINNEQFDEANKILNFIAPLWFAANYGYKYHELVKRWNMAVKDKIVTATHHKTRMKWEQVLENVVWTTRIMI